MIPHERTWRQNQIACDECGMGFKYKYQVNIHSQKHHGMPKFSWNKIHYQCTAKKLVESHMGLFWLQREPRAKQVTFSVLRPEFWSL